ncbi:inorganic pyrophosphatase [Rhodovulum bhavnagarense]|uniref:Inorganic pyrophosphatase n=1 Tax=Rhodovulum bhavnagarense TaxID=992286 RepID=A0A4R2RGX6_9RHOB|nr:inorganic pyrophosphatase [Rhodovulum bhavnagarense]TCP62213.1 inorganic pyrophosphatase [Rhodovulum bhavnagarense]
MIAAGLPDRFWPFADAFVAGARLVIDRPRGSTHPRFAQITYPLDYGYLEGTRAIDGDGVDVWRGSLGAGQVTGVLASLDLTKRDGELKLLLDCTADELARIDAFHNQAEWVAGVLIRRPEGV